jgi:hypothetical protein
MQTLVRVRLQPVERLLHGHSDDALVQMLGVGMCT